MISLIRHVQPPHWLMNLAVAPPGGLVPIVSNAFPGRSPSSFTNAVGTVEVAFGKFLKILRPASQRQDVTPFAAFRSG